jgi:hypothetical protein
MDHHICALGAKFSVRKAQAIDDICLVAIFFSKKARSELSSFNPARVLQRNFTRQQSS